MASPSGPCDRDGTGDHLKERIMPLNILVPVAGTDISRRPRNRIALARACNADDGSSNVANAGTSKPGRPRERRHEQAIL